MKRLMVVFLIISIFLVTTGADFTSEINQDVTFEQSSLFDQLARRWNNRKVGWAAGCYDIDHHHNGFIIYTEDGGENWVSQVDEGGLSMCVGGVSAANQNTAWVVGDAHDGYGTILRTRNRGKKWVRQGSAGEIPDVNFVAVSAVSPSIAWIAGNNGVILKTKNGGRTWERQAGDLVPKIAFQDLYALDRNNVWASGDDAASDVPYIIHTKNGGKTWNIVDVDISMDDTDSLLGVYAVNRDLIWVVGRSGFVMFSTDGGKHWTEATRSMGPNYDNNNVVAFDDKIVWVASDYNVINYTDNGGQTWKNQLASGLSGGSQYNMGITAMNKNEAWVVGDASDGIGIIYHTTDGGENWSPQVNPVVSSFMRISFAGALR